MSFTLIPPGERIKIRNGRSYPNKHWIARGRFDGRLREKTLKGTRNKGDAEKAAAELVLEIASRRVPGPGEAVTLGRAAELYIAWKQPSKGDTRRILRVVAAIGADKLCGEIVQADIVAAGDTLFPGRTNEYKNRWALKPAAAIVHYAAENKWCPWQRFRKREERDPVTRASSAKVARVILQALEAEYNAATTPAKRVSAYKKRLFVTWLFKQGNRVSEPLRVRWDEHIFLSRKVYALFVGKARSGGKKGKWKEKPIDEEVFELLANDPDKAGYLFPWRTRSGVYRWLRPLCERLGVEFTPHRARHYLGKQLNAEGEGLKTIMEALDQSDPQSAKRYQDADINIVRRALRRAGRITNRGGRAGKSTREAQ